MYSCISIGSKLYNLRKKSGLSRKDLGSVMLASHQTIWRWENSLVSPNCATLCKIANYFGVTVDYLLSNTDESSEVVPSCFADPVRAGSSVSPQ